MLIVFRQSTVMQFGLYTITMTTTTHTYLKEKKTMLSVVWATVSTTVTKIKADNLTLECYSTIRILKHYCYSNSDKNITPNKWIRVCIFF